MYKKLLILLLIIVFHSIAKEDSVEKLEKPFGFYMGCEIGHDFVFGGLGESEIFTSRTSIYNVWIDDYVYTTKGYLLPDLSNTFEVGLAFGVKINKSNIHLSVSGSFYNYAYSDSLDKALPDLGIEDQTALAVSANFKFYQHLTTGKIQPFVMVGGSVVPSLIIEDGKLDGSEDELTGDIYFYNSGDYSLNGWGLTFGGGVTLIPHSRFPFDIELSYSPMFYKEKDLGIPSSATHQINLMFRTLIGIKLW